MDNMKKKIKEALTKSMREEKEFLFEGIDFYKTKSLDEFFSENDREDYIWEESLGESLYEAKDEIVGNRKEQYKVGDIILTTRYKSRGSYVEDSPHKIMVITSKKEADGIINYSGFLFSSKAKEKANKYNPKYPHNIYIKNYSSVLYKGTPSDREAFIRVDDLVTFTNMDLSTTGSYKGSASYDFMNFIQKCVDNYRRGLDNSKMHWDK